MKTILEAVSFRNLEQDCEHRFLIGGPYWHLYTNGNKADIIFCSDDDFKIGMNIIGICILRLSEVEVYTFELMNNHLHLILSGERRKCLELFETIKSMLKRYFRRNGRIVDLRDFECEMIEITNLQSLRNEIVYVNRNGYVTRPDCTPFSYPWGSGACFFNHFLKYLPYVKYDILTVKQKREICRSNNICLPPDRAKVFEGVILPSSYCRIDKAEAFFRNAHHYFQFLSRKHEAYSEVADRLHESVLIPDEEMYSAVCSLCMKLYNAKNPGALGAKERIEMARQMRQKYNASNRQIRNILKLDKNIVEELFPQHKP